jgi:G3E family GTPase
MEIFMTTSFSPQEDGKAKTIILSGFLGAGKTTLLKRILTWKQDLSGTVVIVNEFGDLGIDKMLLKDSRSGIVELVGGCVCCSLKTDLILTLKKIWDEFSPRQILIEASGVASPGAIIEAMRDKTVKAHLAVPKVVTVLESDVWDNRENFGSFFLSQLNEADLILLNKIDNLEQDLIPKTLKEIHEAIPDAQIVPTIFCNIDPESLWISESHKKESDIPDRFLNLFPSAEGNENRVQDHDHEHNSYRTGPHNHEADKMGFKSFSFQSDELLDESCFNQFIRGLPWELFRVKGFVRFQNRSVMLNYVGGKAEWTDWTDIEETRLAFVGLNVKGDETILELKNCIARSS